MTLEIVVYGLAGVVALWIGYSFAAMYDTNHRLRELERASSASSKGEPKKYWYAIQLRKNAIPTPTKKTQTKPRRKR
jgi:hypothetical protein